MTVPAHSLTRILALALPLGLGTLPCFATEFVRPRPLMEYADVELAQGLDQAVQAFNARLMQCMQQKPGESSTCHCRYLEERDTAKAAYEKTLQARPKWKGKILYWKNPETQASRELVMPAVEHQLVASAPQCSTSPAP